MDFFAHQDRARRNTVLLVVLFVLAVLLIVAAIYAVTAAIAFWLQTSQAQDVETPALLLWQPGLLLWVVAGVLVVVAVGSLYKIVSLKGGGASVALFLGGRPVEPGAQDPAERRLLNVVEEMAIASGIPVPAVYLLEDESGINAFAAGFSTRDAVIGVTRGCCRLLSRDELQGVIAHEFSHILNGDMRLNLRLMGILHGILLIALIGYGVLRVTLRSMSAGGRKKSKGDVILLAVILFSLALVVIGYIGVFFGHLIKSAVSRQREFLADAASVQFTRNPLGISGALKKIGGLGSRLATVHAEQASHLFFGNALKASWFNLMSTHPALEERIRRVEPSFDGTFPTRVTETLSWADMKDEPAPGVSGLTRKPPERREPIQLRKAAQASPQPWESVSIDTGHVVEQIGTLSPELVLYAATLIASIPEPLKDAARVTAGAQALVFGLLLSADDNIRRLQLKDVEAGGFTAIAPEAVRLAGLVGSLKPEQRLPLVDMALGALKRLAPAETDSFREVVRRLAEADAEVTLFEYALQRMVGRTLGKSDRPGRMRLLRHRVLTSVGAECAVLLSTLAYYGHREAEQARKVFAAGATRLAPELTLELLPAGRCGLAGVDAALKTLAEALPAIKKRALDACAACVAADGVVKAEEAELLRAIADSLDCPLPPFLPAVV